jgi:uncharacterized membrane protein
MTRLLKAISYVGLAVTVLAPLLAWVSGTSTDTSNRVLVVGMVLWFGAAVFWIRRGGTDG